TDEDADAIVTAVMSLTKEQVPLAAQKQLSADDRVVERGRRLVRQWNCQGCHQIGERGGTIRAVVEDQLESSGGEVIQAQALSPPMLYNPKPRIGKARACTRTGSTTSSATPRTRSGPGCTCACPRSTSRRRS